MEDDDVPLLRLDPITEDFQYPQFLHGILIRAEMQSSKVPMEICNKLQVGSQISARMVICICACGQQQAAGATAAATCANT